MPVAYDENMILSFADDLYRRAAALVIGHTAVGGLIGGAAGLAGGLAIAAPNGVGAVVAAVLGGVIGRSLGRSRAFALRLAAQTALCQVRIERNTRQAWMADRAMATATDLPPPFAVGNAGAFPAQHYDR